MGTSQSSKGSPSGVPMVPPWVPDISTSDENSPNSNSGQEENKPLSQPISIAPPRRFQGANRSLGEYARTGEHTRMHHGLGQYVKKGYGGSSTAARRKGGTSQTAQALYSALSGGGAVFAAGTEGNEVVDTKLSTGRSADEVMDAIIEAVKPVDGTQDTEASRASIKDSLSEVLKQYPDADLLNLRPEQRELAIERFVAADIFRRIDLDLGRTIREKVPNATTGLRRLKEVKAYVKEVVAESFRKLKNTGQRLITGRVAQIVQNAISETFQVFEEYAK